MSRATLGEIHDNGFDPAELLSVPDPFRNSATAARFGHSDLACLTDFALWQQRERARLALVLMDSPDPWFSERVQACRAEAERRRVKR